MAIIYEWTREQIVEGEVTEVHFSGKLKDLPELEGKSDLGLIKRKGNNLDGEQERSYSYVIDGNLQREFDDGSPVPEKYITEFTQEMEKRNIQNRYKDIEAAELFLNTSKAEMMEIIRSFATLLKDKDQSWAEKALQEREILRINGII